MAEHIRVDPAREAGPAGGRLARKCLMHGEPVAGGEPWRRTKYPPIGPRTSSSSPRLSSSARYGDGRRAPRVSRRGTVLRCPTSSHLPALAEPQARAVGGGSPLSPVAAGAIETRAVVRAITDRIAQVSENARDRMDRIAERDVV